VGRNEQEGDVSGMIITVAVLVILAVLFLLPNYIAVRYALLGDVLAGGQGVVRRRKEAAPAEQAAAAPVLRRTVLQLWKAFSPLVFAICLILAIAVGGMEGLALAGAAFLNLLWGFTGWRGS